LTSRLTEYLNYYKTCDAPGYAVLVTGEWGTGKTYQIKKALKKCEYYYVSLYGLQSAADIHSEILAVADPNLEAARGIIKNISKATTDARGVYAISGALFSGTVNAMLRKKLKPNRVLIFDDLERCGLNLKDTLGVINTYVEHYGFRVIVVAHDKKLTKKFKKKKEKLFGQTIKVEPQTELAFEAFNNKTKNRSARKFIKDHQHVIVGVFKDSKEKSLRILRHVIEDLARLYAYLDETHLNHKEAMIELVSLFSALNIEVRAGNLLENDIKKRKKIFLIYYMRNASQSNTTPNKPPFIKANNKYKTIDLENNILQDETCLKMFVEGCYNATVIKKTLNDYHFFLIPEDEPPWKIVWNFRGLEDGVVEKAKTKMQEQFEHREVTIFLLCE